MPALVIVPFGVLSVPAGAGLVEIDGDDRSVGRGACPIAEIAYQEVTPE